MVNPIFISGMYKSGTTWLLSILGAHPATNAFRELDVVKAFYDVHIPSQTYTPYDPAQRLRQVLGSSPYSQLSAPALDALLSGDPASWPPEVTEPGKLRPVSQFQNLDAGLKQQIIHGLLNQPDAQQALHDFVALHKFDDRRPVFKGADQIPRCAGLDAAFPTHRKLVVIRDGRDVAVSAHFFRQLMRQRNAQWVSANDVSMMDTFTAWAGRVAMLRKRMQTDQNLYVLRYEDLNLRFQDTMQGVLQWLELDHDAALLQQLENQTSFEAQSGRKRGEESAAVMRKGIVGDWLNHIEGADAEAAWTAGAEALTAFGYGRDGTLSDWR